ncbi:hypothetical protein [Shinella sp.]|uniref:hypothetical protein n=1 Tax=Shinella sp. TaxID=1870904 RepID=UPI0039E5D5CD
MTEKLATNIAMEANAARSRRKSVILASFPFMFLVCSIFVHASTGFPQAPGKTFRPQGFVNARVKSKA